MDKSSSATCLLYSDVVKGDPSTTWIRNYQEEDEKKRREKGSQGVGYFRFINILKPFYLFIF